MIESSDSAIGFAEKVLAILDRGTFTSTYKHAVLLSLIDLCLERTGPDGQPPETLSTRDIAEKVLQLYWPHTVPYPSAVERAVLRQNTRGQEEIISYITAFLSHYASDPSASLGRASRLAPEPFEQLIQTVEWKVAQMPLPRLQTVGTFSDPFIYQLEWEADSSRRQFFSGPRTIRFKPHSAGHLIRLAPLLRPLIQREWTSRVARLNRSILEDSHLEDFLFGRKRVATGALQTDLREIQKNECFYCAHPIPKTGVIDHFVPWARYPDNGVHNLVITHRQCNSRKSDHLAAGIHVARWRRRFDGAEADDLQEVAASKKWDHHPQRTAAVARAIYFGLPDDALLWRADYDFTRVEDQRAVIQSALAGI